MTLRSSSVAWTRTLSPILLVLPLGGCGGDSDGGGGGGSSNDEARVDVGVMDAPVDQLAAFHTVLDELHLVHDDGTETSNLLPVPIGVEFLGLADRFVWLSSKGIAPGTYVGARVSFVEDSTKALGEDGATIAVGSQADDLEVTFATPLELAPEDYRSVLIDLDLAESLRVEQETAGLPGVLDPTADVEGDPAGPPLVFLPQGSISTDNGAQLYPLDAINGRVLEVDANSGHLLIQALVGGTLQLDLGSVDVIVADSSFLLSEQGVTLTREDFLTSLLPNQTMLQIHGQLVGGAVQASQIEIEDLDGEGQEVLPVRVEGLVLSHEPNASFELLLMEVEKGSAIVDPVLEELGDPTSITIVYDAGTLFLAADGGGMTTPEALAPGQRIEVDFAQFLSNPLQASRIELVDSSPRADGFLVDTTGLPAEFVMHVEAGEAVIGNQVASTETDVLVHLGGATIFLQTEGHPALDAAMLPSGARVVVEGRFDGPPDSPSVTAGVVEVRPGRLEEAVVTSIDRATLSFTAEGGVIADPFGIGIQTGSYRITFDERAVVEDGATSIEGFFALYESLVAPQRLFIEVEGIGSVTSPVPTFLLDQTGSVSANSILAFEVEVRVVQ